MLRLSHRDDEYDFGFATIKVLKRLGLAKATPSGRTIPKEVGLPALDF